ncbi:MAG: SPOR domain-containing protein [Burkholderiaceae bacterium]
MRARQRLIGAVVLVVIGIIGFPLVFETQPRPIPLNIPIEIPRKDGAPPLALPAERAAPAGPVASTAARPLANALPATSAPATRPRDEVITETRDDAGRELEGAKPARAAEPSPKQAIATPTQPPPKPVAEVRPPQRAEEGARAQALLEGKAAPKAEAGRFVVQVGAFAEASAAREMRLKVEKLGLKTYTQVTSTAAGNRIRVRVGPFATRGEADKALAKAHSAGLTAVVLTL